MSCRRITVRNLILDSSGTHARRLVDGVGFELEGGASLALVGASGAGKSLTAGAILGLIPKGVRKISGEIIVNDRAVEHLGRRELRHLRAREVGIILQNPQSAFDPVFTIASHFKETIAAGGGDTDGSIRDWRRRALAALAEADLANPEEVLAAYPFQLSGGMAQRVMLALALVNNPDYLIADEATSDLDSQSQRRILDLLDARRRERHLGLLLITHDFGVAERMAGEVAILHAGRLVESGPTAAVLSRPRSPRARELVEAHRSLYGERFCRLIHRSEGERHDGA